MRLSILIKLFLLLPLLAQAEDEFTFYVPKYRTTEELVRLGESHFGGKATFSSLGGKIVINSSRPTAQNVLKLFAELDQRARQYKISFRLTSRVEGSRNSIGFKNGQVTVGKRVSAGGTLSAESGSGESQKNIVQSAQVVEGTDAQVSLGDTWAPGGFFAKVRGGAGDLVTLEFRQREPKANPALSLQSEAAVKLGEWKTVGEVTQATSGSQQGILSRGSNAGTEKKDLQVKLERSP